MKFIIVNPKTGEVELTNKVATSIIAIPTDKEKVDVLGNELAKFTLFDVLYPLRWEHDIKQGRRPGKYKLYPPDPWLLAIVAVMWEGILQGMAWDAIKVVVQHALARLRKSGLAPVPPVETQTIKKSEKKSVTKVGFTWTEYGQEGEPLTELFLGVWRAHEKKTESKRKSFSKK